MRHGWENPERIQPSTAVYVCPLAFIRGSILPARDAAPLSFRYRYRYRNRPIRKPHSAIRNSPALNLLTMPDFLPIRRRENTAPVRSEK